MAIIAITGLTHDIYETASTMKFTIAFAGGVIAGCFGTLTRYHN